MNQGGEGARVEVLESGLWRRLGEAGAEGEFYVAWLTLQCARIAGARQGVVVLVGADGVPRPTALWPDATLASPLLAQAAEAALTERRGCIRRGGSAAALAFPLLVGADAAGVVAVEIAGDGDVRATTRELEWGAAWLRERLGRQRETTASATAERMTLALEVVGKTLAEERFLAACRAATTELAHRLDCERVSLGVVTGQRVRVVAVSHSATFGKRMNLVRDLAAAMEEAVEQHAALLHPHGEDEPLLTRAQATLARNHGSAAVLTLPLFPHDRFTAVLTAERPGDRPFDQRTVDLLAATGELLAPTLEEKRRNDRWLVVKAASSLREQALRLLGPGHAGRKLAVIAAVALAVLGSVVTGTYRVSARATVEGQIQRAVVAPFDGFIDEAPARAGDVVGVGQTLVKLDDRDLQLQRLGLVTERQQRQLAYEQALGGGLRTELGITRAQIDKADAEVALLDELLARSLLAAPFAGVVVKGDLSQSIGAPVRRGDVLFEVAPLDAYRVVIEVDESRIADIRQGQSGTLLATALPRDPFPILVQLVTPVAKVREGQTVFRVEAVVEGGSAALRPGMDGVARIDVDNRLVVAIWTRGLLDWLRLKTWAWLP